MENEKPRDSVIGETFFRFSWGEFRRISRLPTICDKNPKFDSNQKSAVDAGNVVASN
jgi:hypothetical protein